MPSDVPCEIGWEFWCKEGNALPDRTVKVLKETTCGLFGAITSNRKVSQGRIGAGMKEKGWFTFLPSSGCPMFNLHTTCGCKSYPATRSIIGE